MMLMLMLLLLLDWPNWIASHRISLPYFSLPQTWEDPTFVHPDAEGCKGDNDPVDVVEIGAKIVPVGVSSLTIETSPDNF